MRSPVRLSLLFLTGLCFASALTALLLPGGSELRLTPIAGGEPILICHLQPGERFTLRYIHSVNHRPIWEEHSVDEEGRIFIEEERFMSFSAGMGHWQGHGRLVNRGEHQVIENIHKPIGHFILRVGSPGVDHSILWRGLEFNLSRVAAGEALLVRAQNISILAYAWRRFLPPPRTLVSGDHPSHE